MKGSTEHIDHLLRSWEFRPVDSEPEEKQATLWKQLFGAWMRFAKMLGKANAFLLLSLVYFLVFGPAAIVLKLLGKDLLDRKAEQGESYWYDKGHDDHGLERSKHQF